MFGASPPPVDLESAFGRPAADWTGEEVSAICDWLYAEPQLRRLLIVAGMVLGSKRSVDRQEEAVQEFFATAFWGFVRNWNPAKGTFSAYFGTVFRNHCLAYRKRIGVCDGREGTLTEEHANDPVVSVPAIEYLGDESAPLGKCIEELPEHHRAVVILFCFLDQPHCEIAETLGISEGNSRVRLIRSKSSLKACLEALGVESS